MDPKAPDQSQPALPVHLRGPRVLLVPPEPDRHLENFLIWMNDREVTRWVSRTMPISRLQEEKWFERAAESEDGVVWAVHDEAGRHIGVTGIHAIDWKQRSGITGTIIGDKTAWGKGYGSEVMQLRTQFAFEEMGLHRLESECFVENIGSATCLERAGFRKYGTARKSRWRGGQWHDCYRWEILDEDYFAAKA